ncbi:MAG TPA: polysulfide reductase NrfD [Desulfuromonadales bacterium]|nr:polysulfide reductase NrfD [Desulfuromonadales bacterium]
MQIYGVLIPKKEQISGYLKEFQQGKGGVLVYLSLVGLLVGGVGVGCIFMLGHGHTINTSSYVPWGLQISTYVFFALVSGGCIFTNFIGNMFFPHHYRSLASRVIFLGLITAIAGFASLASELGHVERMYMFLLSPNPTSPMFWMSVWYSADITILIIEYIHIQRRRHSKGMLYASFVIPVITYCSLGSLFGAVGTMPYYYSSLLPIYFLFSGFLTGNALCAIVAAQQSRRTGNQAAMKPFMRMQKIGLASVFVLTFCRIIVGLSSHQSGYEIFRETFFQNVVFGMLGALVGPFMILMYRRTSAALIFSSVLVLITQFLARLDLVVEGFRVPVFRVYDMPERISYFPSIFEMLVVVFSLSAVALIYIVCEKMGLFEIAETIKGGH